MEIKELNQIINEFKEPYVLNKYKKRNYIILEKFLKELQYRKEVLVEILKEENKIWNIEFDIDVTLNKILNEYNELKEVNNKRFGLGNIVSITNGDIYLQIDLIIKAVLSNCRILFINSPILFNFNTYIISIVQEILEEENLNRNLVSAVNSITYKKQLIDNQKYIDCIIINKDYDEYSYFREKFDCKVVYLDYGNINVYADSDEFEDEIKKIVDKTEKLNMDVYKYDIEDIEEFFSKEINNFIFNTVVIFSKDIKKCMRFFEAIKSNNVFINKFDLNEIRVGLEIEKLQFEKELIIKK